MDGTVHIIFLQARRQSLRFLPQQERCQAESEPQQLGRRLECQLSFLGGSLLSLFLLVSLTRSFTYELTFPATKHPANFCQSLCEMSVLVAIKRLGLPSEL